MDFNFLGKKKPEEKPGERKQYSYPPKESSSSKKVTNQEKPDSAYERFLRNPEKAFIDTADKFLRRTRELEQQEIRLKAKEKELQEQQKVHEIRRKQLQRREEKRNQIQLEQELKEEEKLLEQKKLEEQQKSTATSVSFDFPALTTSSASSSTSSSSVSSASSIQPSAPPEHLLTTPQIIPAPAMSQEDSSKQTIAQIHAVPDQQKVDTANSSETTETTETVPSTMALPQNQNPNLSKSEKKAIPDENIKEHFLRHQPSKATIKRYAELYVEDPNLSNFDPDKPCIEEAHKMVRNRDLVSALIKEYDSLIKQGQVDRDQANHILDEVEDRRDRWKDASDAFYSCLSSCEDDETCKKASNLIKQNFWDLDRELSVYISTLNDIISEVNRQPVARGDSPPAPDYLNSTFLTEDDSTAYDTALDLENLDQSRMYPGLPESDHQLELQPPSGAPSSLAANIQALSVQPSRNPTTELNNSESLPAVSMSSIPRMPRPTAPTPRLIPRSASAGNPATHAVSRQHQLPQAPSRYVEFPPGPQGSQLPLTLTGNPFLNDFPPSYQQPETKKIVPSDLEERKNQFKMEYLTDSKNARKASHNAPKLTLTTLSRSTLLEDFFTFWTAFEDSVERTDKTWADKLFLLHQYLDSDLKKTFSAFPIAKARLLKGEEKDNVFFDIYMACKATLFDRVEDDSYSTTDRAIASLPNLSSSGNAPPHQLYQYQDVLMKLLTGDLANMDAEHDPYLKQMKLKLYQTPYLARYENFLYPEHGDNLPDSLNSMALFFKNLVEKSKFRSKFKQFASGVSAFQQPKQQPKPGGGKVTTHAVETEKVTQTTSGNVGKPTKPKVDTKKVCLYCSTLSKIHNHEIGECFLFKKLPFVKRKEFAYKNKICYYCMTVHGNPRNCPNKKKCPQCDHEHHQAMHNDKTNSSNEEQKPKEVTTHQTQIEGQIGKMSPHVLPVYLKHKITGKVMQVLMYLDGGTDKTIILRSVADSLGLQGEEEMVKLTTLNKSEMVPGIYTNDFEIIAMDKSVKTDIKAVALNFQPSGRYHEPAKVKRNYKHLAGIEFPTHQVTKEQGFSILLGRDHWHLLATTETRFGQKAEQPIAIKYPLGWVLSVPEDTNSAIGCYRVEVERTGKSLPTKDPQTFLDKTPESYIEEIAKTEFIGCETKETQFSPADERTKARMIESMKVKDGSMLEMEIPFNAMITELTNNYHEVKRRQAMFERKLIKENLHQVYWSLIQKQLEKGFYTELKDKEPDIGKKHYLFHFYVTKESLTTPKRIVHDAKAKIGCSISFNQAVETGPDFQNPLFDILVNFRIGDTAFVGDISSMYSMLHLPKNQWDLNRFLFRPPGESEFRIFCHNRWWFGCAASPAAAQLAAIVTAENNKEKYPLGSKVVLNHRYMDDSCFSINGLESAIKALKETISIYNLIDMSTQKVLSNKKELMLSVPIEQRLQSYESGELPTTKVLGYPWDPNTDLLSIPVTTIEGIIPNTKRNLLIILASLFDPCGWLAPFLVLSRMLHQQTWLAGLDWDDPLPDHLQKEANRWFAQLSEIKDFKIRRQVLKEPIKEIHIFADSSDLAYGCVAYAVGETDSYILVSKGRVHAIKPQSIPRKELIAAVLATKIGKSLKEIFPEIPFFYWSDSQNVLAWIKNDSKLLKQFVANRVAYIHERTNPSQWRFVGTADNPADIVSRGANMKDLINNPLWLKGSSFLSNKDIPWPKQKHYGLPTEELKKEETKQIFSYSTGTNDALNFENFNNLNEIIDFQVQKLREQNGKDQTAVITAQEHEQALIELIKIAQEHSFSDEISRLRANQRITRRSKVFKLCPRLDPDQQILRLNTRLSNSTSLPFDTRCPILLPKKHHLTKLIIKDADESINHIYGTNYLVHKLRERFWIVAARQAVKIVRKECMDCQRLHAKPVAPMMAPLPQHRVDQPAKAFQKIGIDYTGAFLTKQGRGMVRAKRYGVVFTCTATRAVHWEIAYNMETSGFFDAFNRFLARRGPVTDVYSDNGTNFVGANRELKELVQQLPNDELQEYARKHKFDWHFQPPNSPHFGGIHESMIKSGKKAVRAIIGNSELTDIELMTAFALAEDLINSRPLMFMTDDPGDFRVLTPAMFLHGRLSGQTFPDVIDTTAFDPRNRWRYVQRCLSEVWKRWIKELLPSLGPRQKWIADNRDYQVGDQVLIVSKDLPRYKWKPARITATYPGRDNRTRVVDVESEGGNFQTSVHRLIPLT